MKIKSIKEGRASLWNIPETNILYCKSTIFQLKKKKKRVELRELHNLVKC